MFKCFKGTERRKDVEGQDFLFEIIDDRNLQNKIEELTYLQCDILLDNIYGYLEDCEEDEE